MENSIKNPVVILTRDISSGTDLADYLRSRYPDRELQISVIGSAAELPDHLTVKHNNILIVDYDQELFQQAEDVIYNQPGKMATSLTLSSYYDVQFILRKPSQHETVSLISNKHGVPEMVVEDHKDYESVALLADELLSQRTVRKDFRTKNIVLAAALLVFCLIFAIIIF